MRPHNGRMPPVEDVGRGDVKTPPLWHTAAKMPVGRWYTDGSFHGPFPLMASSMELEKDRPFDALVEVVSCRASSAISSRSCGTSGRRGIPTRSTRRSRHAGARLCSTRKDVGCSAATASTTGTGNVRWPGVHTDVATDRSRLDVVSDGFVAAFNASPLAAEGALAKSRGYAATPLTGVWANFPYLHNGSVPTLHHLLGPGFRAAEDLRSDGGPAVGSRAGRPAALPPIRGRVSWRGGAVAPLRRRSQLVQHRRGLDRATAATTSGRGSDGREPAALIEYLKTL